MARPSRLAPICLAFAAVSLTACERSDTSTTPLEVGPPPLSQTTPATAAQLCEEAPRAWSILSDGVPVAETMGGCVGIENGQAHLLTQLVHDDAVQYEMHVWLDPDGAPRLAQMRTPTVVTDYAWTNEGLTEHKLGDDRTLPSQDGQTIWVVPSHAVYLREVMLRLGVGVTADGARLLGYAPDVDALSNLRVELKRDGDDDGARATAGPGVFDLRGADAGLAGLHIARVSAGELPFYAALTTAPLLESVLSDRPEPRYIPDDRLTIEATKISGTGGPTLAGDLVFTAGDPDTPRPGVLFISGTGAQTRLGMIAGPDGTAVVDLGSHEIHDALALSGSVVLRYDDRGVGESEHGRDATFGFDAQIDDARRALRALAADPRVDRSRLIIVGHGEGALMAAILGQEKVRGGSPQRPAGVVLLAAPGRNIRQLVYGQIRHALVERSEFEIRMAVDEARRIHEAALADEDLPASSEGLRSWMQEIFALDPLAEVRALKVPVLALHGAKDFQVDPVKDYELIKTATRDGAEGSTAQRFADVDHLFMPEPGRSHAGHYRDLRRHVDPAVLDTMIEWTRARTAD